MSRPIAPDDLAQFCSWCPVCKMQIETPLGPPDFWDHLLDAHREWLLSSHGRKVVAKTRSSR